MAQYEILYLPVTFIKCALSKECLFGVEFQQEKIRGYTHAEIKCRGIYTGLQIDVSAPRLIKDLQKKGTLEIISDNYVVDMVTQFETEDPQTPLPEISLITKYIPFHTVRNENMAYIIHSKVSSYILTEITIPASVPTSAQITEIYGRHNFDDEEFRAACGIHYYTKTCCRHCRKL